jgi:hypothetical protein
MRAETKTTDISLSRATLYKLPTLELDAPATNFPTAVIPDAALRSALQDRDLIEDTNDGAGTVKIVDADATTINLDGVAGITDITGLEVFSELTTLSISGTRIVNLDLTPFTNLTSFTSNASAPNYDLISVDAHGLTTLTTLTLLNNNNMESLNISGCTALTGCYINTSASSIAYSSIINGSVLQLGPSSAYYRPSLKTLTAEGLTQITKVVHAYEANPAIIAPDMTITNLSLKNCPNIASMILAGAKQKTAVTINIVGTPLADDLSLITNKDTDPAGLYTFITTE